MENSADKDSVGVNSIENNVPLMLDAVVSRSDSITSAADFRSLGNSIEAGFQVVQISESLLYAPSIERVIGNIDQVESCQSRKPMSLQSSGLALHPGAHSHSITKFGKDVALGHSALFACKNGSTQCVEFCLIFLFCLIQRP